MSSRSRGPGRLLQRIVLSLVAMGVVIGFWRWLGQGSDITDEGWLGHVTDTVSGVADGLKGLVGKAVDGVTR
ncbi:hypothetical protein [Streptomyces sp. NPDC058268]|uniref:hypothetical protein n=1 Tax=Streptomyces sp. NPDC058268 TaxID=3346413 RepID=UPI0036E7A33F